MFAVAQQDLVGSFTHYFSSVEAIAALLGLSGLGVVAAMRASYRWTAATTHRRRDRHKLGDRDYATWQRLARQSGMDLQHRSLAWHIEAAGKELDARVTDALTIEIDERLARPASGSIDLTYSDLLETKDLLIEQDFATADGQVLAGGAAHLPLVRLNPPARLLVVGEAGTGKSLMCRGIEHAWLDTGTPGLWLFTIEPTDVGGGEPGSAQTIGSKEWVLEIIRRRLLGDLSPFERKVLSDRLDSALDLMIDGLDEIADHLAPTDSERFLNSWAMRHASLVTVRTSFYEAFLIGSNTLAGFNIVFAQETAEQQVLRFIDALSSRMYPPDEAKVHSAAAKALRLRADAVRELTHNPLLLTMYVSLREFHDSEAVDVATVYREFVRQSLSRERAEGRTTLPLEILTSALCEAAWLVFRRRSSFATRNMLLDAVTALTEVSPADRYAVVKDLEACSLLALRRAPLAAAEDYRASFYHKSFEDYFVARRVEDWLCGRGGDRGEDFFYHIDTPEVTFFLKEAISKVVSDPVLQEDASARLQAVLLRLLSDRRAAADEVAARTSAFAAGQVAYYLGILGEPAVQRWLEEIVESEEDFWIKRAAVIGLAFGGDKEPCHQFIDDMTESMERGDLAMARMNIAIELGFYGDQKFDPLDPTRDAGGDTCRRLVARSILELGMDIEAANWRMILFNLTYLAQHRGASREAFWEEIEPRRTELLSALHAMQDDPERSAYPEIGQLIQILS
jgi:hypothetical protein